MDETNKVKLTLKQSKYQHNFTLKVHNHYKFVRSLKQCTNPKIHKTD